MVDFIQWANAEKTALYVQAPKTISEQDVKIILATLMTLTAEVDYPIDLIVDRRDTISVPRKMLTVLRRIVTSRQYQRIVFIGFSTFPKLVVETLTNLPGMFTFDPIFADSLDEACTVLNITFANPDDLAHD